MQIALFILWLAHVLACVWYGIGQWAPTGSTGQRWINTPVPGTEHLLISESGIAYKYTSAYHWLRQRAALHAHLETCYYSGRTGHQSSEQLGTITCNRMQLLRSVVWRDLGVCACNNHDRTSGVPALDHPRCFTKCGLSRNHHAPSHVVQVKHG
eukprot:633220-Amphidinium_carterae.2